jgi:DNA-binding GntR family transcriptional regulator
MKTSSPAERRRPAAGGTAAPRSAQSPASRAKAKRRRPRLNPAAIATALRQSIQGGGLVPGQRLVEIDVMRRVAVSRACVRAALRELESEGLVDIVKNQGAFVRRTSRKEVLDILDVLDELSVLTIRRVVARLEVPAVHRIVESALVEARKFQAELARQQPIARYVEETNKLWNMLTHGTDNPTLEEAHARLQSLLHRIRLTGFVFKGKENRWVSWHVDMVAAIAAGNERLAIELMWSAARESRAAIMSLPDESFG